MVARLAGYSNYVGGLAYKARFGCEVSSNLTHLALFCDLHEDCFYPHLGTDHAFNPHQIGQGCDRHCHSPDPQTVLSEYATLKSVSLLNRTANLSRLQQVHQVGTGPCSLDCALWRPRSMGSKVEEEPEVSFPFLCCHLLLSEGQIIRVV